MLNSLKASLSAEKQKEFNAIALNGSLGILGQAVTAIALYFFSSVASSKNFFVIPALGATATFLGTIFSLYGVLKDKAKPISLGSLIRLLTSVYIMYAVVAETGYLASAFIATFPLFIAGIMYSFGVKKAKALLVIELGILFYFFFTQPKTDLAGYSLIIELFAISLTFFIIFLFDKNAGEYQQVILQEKDRAETLRKEAEASNNNIRSILSSTPNLVVIFSMDSIIAASAAFRELNASASNAHDICTMFHEDQRASLLSAVEAILDEDELNYEMNGALLPHQTRFQGKLHNVTWSPIVEGGVVSRLQLEAVDIEEISRLQERAETDQLILTVHKTHPQKLLSFTKACFHYLNDALNKVEGDLIANKRDAYIDLHTGKGAARTLGFMTLATAIHEAEENVNREDKQKALTHIQKAIAILKSIDIIVNERFRGDSSKQKADDINRALKEGKERAFLLSLLPSLFNLVEGCEEDVKKIAADLGKPSPRLLRAGEDVRLTERAEAVFEKMLVHVLRNALDHGLENAQERVASGKDEIGSIAFISKPEGDHWMVSIGDDGRGLNLNRIKDKAVNLGLLSPEVNDPKTIANAIFLPGFSTAATLTQVSGRGVGMDAVRESILSIGGRVELRLEKVHANGFADWVLEVFIPRDHVLAA